MKSLPNINSLEGKEELLNYMFNFFHFLKNDVDFSSHTNIYLKPNFFQVLEPGPNHFNLINNQPDFASFEILIGSCCLSCENFFENKKDFKHEPFLTLLMVSNLVDFPSCRDIEIKESTTFKDFISYFNPQFLKIFLHHELNEQLKLNTNNLPSIKI